MLPYLSPLLTAIEFGAGGVQKWFKGSRGLGGALTSSPTHALWS